MRGKSYLHKSIMWELGLLTYHLQTEAKKTGIQPITFEDQFGNKITRNYDYDLGKFAGGSPNNPVKIRVQEGLVSDLAPSAQNQITTNDGVRGYVDIAQLGDEELMKMAKNPAQQVNVAIDNLLAGFDESLGDSRLGKIFPSRQDRQFFMSGVNRAAKQVKDSWQKEGMQGVMGAVGEMWNKARENLSKKIPVADFFMSKEFFGTLGTAAASVGIALAVPVAVFGGLAPAVLAIAPVAGILTAKNHKFFSPNQKEVLKAIEAVVKKKGFNPTTPKGRGLINRALFTLLGAKLPVKNIADVTGQALKDSAGASLGVAKILSPPIAILGTAWAIALGVQSYKDRKNDETKEDNAVPEVEKREKQLTKALNDYEKLLKKIEGADEWEQQRFVNNWLDKWGDLGSEVMGNYSFLSTIPENYSSLPKVGLDKIDTWNRVLAERKRKKLGTDPNPDYQSLEKRVNELTEIVDNEEMDKGIKRASISWRKQVISADIKYGEDLDNYSEDSYQKIFSSIQKHNKTFGEPLANPSFTPQELGGTEVVDTWTEHRTPTSEEQNKLLETADRTINNELAPLYPLSKPILLIKDNAGPRTISSDPFLPWGLKEQLEQRGIIPPLTPRDDLNLILEGRVGSATPSVLDVGNIEYQTFLPSDKLIRDLEKNKNQSMLLSIHSGDLMVEEVLSPNQALEKEAKAILYHEYGHLIEMEKKETANDSAQYLLERAKEVPADVIEQVRKSAELREKWGIDDPNLTLPIEHREYAGQIYNATEENIEHKINKGYINSTELVSTTLEDLSNPKRAKVVLDAGEREKILYTLGVLTK